MNPLSNTKRRGKVFNKKLIIIAVYIMAFMLGMSFIQKSNLSQGVRMGFAVVWIIGLVVMMKAFSPKAPTVETIEKDGMIMARNMGMENVRKIEYKSKVVEGRYLTAKVIADTFEGQKPILVDYYAFDGKFYFTPTIYGKIIEDYGDFHFPDFDNAKNETLDLFKAINFDRVAVWRSFQTPTGLLVITMAYPEMPGEKAYTAGNIPKVAILTYDITDDGRFELAEIEEGKNPVKGYPKDEDIILDVMTKYNLERNKGLKVDRFVENGILLKAICKETITKDKPEEYAMEYKYSPEQGAYT